MSENGESAVVGYVTSSQTREDIVRALSVESRPARALCATLDASESGVYAAVSDLRARGVVETDDDGERLRLTGLGLVVADAVERRERLESVLAADADYWRTHDVRALPSPFRARLDELDGAEVYRVTETDPTGVIRLIHDHLREADEVAVVTPVRFPDLGRTLREVCADRPGRLLITDAVVAEVRRHDDGDVPVPANLDVRVADVSFALAVADGTTFLSLPRLDGSYDPSTELVADADRAAAFGADLFEWLWRDATPIGDVAPTRPL